MENEMKVRNKETEMKIGVRGRETNEDIGEK